VRAVARLAALALLLLVCLPPHLIAKSLGRSRWPPRFLRAAGRICGAQVKTQGTPIGPQTLILANHTSWLDILVLAGATGTRFVSKAEVRNQWLLRWLADQNDTVYIERQDRRAVHRQAAGVADALRDERPLTLFPEGTTGDGLTLLPFRPALLSALADAPPGTTVRPVAIDYGDMSGTLGWTDGESGKENALRLLGRKGSFPVVVRLLPPLDPGRERKALAGQAHAAIAAALKASNSSAAAL
jgi:1-acyl-sn-glycerol-3-phosphate acyltransferase